VDIDLTVQRVPASAGDDQNQIVRELLQAAADVPLGDWFEFTFGPPVMDLTAAPYGGARYSVEARMNERIFARFHLDAGIGDVARMYERRLKGYSAIGYVIRAEASPPDSPAPLTSRVGSA
jgi:hypothetical protein